MDDNIFKKLRVKLSMTALLFHVPEEYPNYEEFSSTQNTKAEFVHLFVASRVEFRARFEKAANAVADNGLFWISYPKSTKKQPYDINRDSIWDLLISRGWHPVSQVSLSDTWSAIRVKRNEAGVVYERSNNIKR